jgi:isopenicillin-N N-acyltransferase-like protein
MHKKAIRFISFASSDPRDIGHEHGESFRTAIREIAAIRMERMREIPHFRRKEDVLELAFKHIALLEAYDKDLYLEFSAISKASNLSLEELIILNNYTDMRDIAADNSSSESGCSIIYNNTANGPILGQTWDIHGSAQDYILLMRVKDCLIFTIVGCLGMTGLNSFGLGLCINNLSSIDAHIGVLWPAIVRKALSKKSAELAKDEIMSVQNGSGRHYALADENNFFGIETSGTKKKIVFEKRELYFHTNHCLDAEMRKTHVIREGSTSEWRYNELDQNIRHQDLSSAEKIFLALKQVSLSPNKSQIHNTATCGSIVMNLKQRSLLACAGIAEEKMLANNSAYFSL